MNLEFHYWIVLFLARKAGLDAGEAWTIAYSSQLTDDRTYPIPLEGPVGRDEVIATQSFGTSDDAPTRAIRLACHFIPGVRAEASRLRVDGEAGALVVTPGSPTAKGLLIAALRSRDPYRIGIALHAYADTWAHANFSGTLDPKNAFADVDPVPPLGHAPALRRPDLLVEIWEDPRLLSPYRRAVNRDRFMAAARMIYKYLATYARRPFADVDRVEAELHALWGRAGEKGRAERFADYAIATGEKPYERDAWLREAGLAEAVAFDPPAEGGLPRALAKALRRGDEWIRTRIGGRTYPVDERYYGSDLARWNAAAKAHLSAFAAMSR